MTRDEIRKAMEWEYFDYPQIEIAITRIEKIIAEVVERERKACAKTADQQVRRWGDCSAQHAASECANAIRARSNP